MADGKVVISTELDNSRIPAGIRAVKGALGGLESVVKKLGTAVGIAFSVRAIIQFGKESVNAANELSAALTGLQSILDGQGRSFSAAQEFINEYTKDGLIPATNAITAYKNLAMRGYDDSQIQQVMVALKDASAFGRQASYSMGEAVQSATEGLKNENSILVDNAGVTKNVAKMWEEYADSIGTTASNLTQQQKIQAEVNGILEESKYQAGDAAKVAGTLSGQLTQLSFNFYNLKVAVGNAINPIIQSFIPVINSAVQALTKFANSVASVVGALFGKASVQTSALAESNSDVTSSASAGADAEEELADATKAAGKAAQKSLASFDELNKLQSDVGSNSSNVSDESSGSTSTSIAADAQVEDTISPKLQAVVDKIKELVEPLKNIDFSPAVEAFGRLGDAASKLGETIGEALEWVWFNILVPLAEWTIEDVLPAFLDLLSAALDTLNGAIEAFEPMGTWLWENFLRPLAEWTGEAFVSTLSEIADLLQKISDLLSGNTSLGEFIASLTPAQTAIAGIATSLATIAAVSSTIKNITSFVAGIKGFLASVDALSATGIAGKIAELLAMLSGAAGPVTSLSDAMQAVFGKVSTVVAGIGSIIGGSVLAVTNFFSMLENGFSWIKEALMVIGVAITAVGAIILGAPALVTGVIAAVVAAVATAVVVIKEHWNEIVTWFSNACSDIGQFFSDLWQGIVDIWNTCAEWFDTNVIQPVCTFFSGLWDSISNLASEAWESIKEFFSPAVDWFTELFDSIWTTISDVFYDIGVIASGCWDIIEAVWDIVADWFDKNVVQPVSGFFSDLWADIENLALNAWNGIKETFSEISGWVDDNIIQPVGDFFSGLWDDAVEKAKDAWEGIKSVFGSVASFFKQIFSDAWAGIVNVFSFAGEIFTNIKDGILTAFKTVVNGIITGINNVVAVPFNGINKALQTVRDINILGLSPFSNLKMISVPQIPYLAQGAVIPPNREFMAVLGDQKHGTNIEAPLETIQEAVSNVLSKGNYGGTNDQQIVDLLQAILEAVLDIELDGEALSNAVHDFDRKKAVSVGG